MDPIQDWLIAHDYYLTDADGEEIWIPNSIERGQTATVQVVPNEDSTYSYYLLGVDDDELNTDVIPLEDLDHLQTVYLQTLL